MLTVNDDKMTGRSNGLFSGRTRYLAKRHKPSQLSITDRIKEVAVGSKVVILPKGNTKDIPHPRYRGRIGEVIEKRGGAYVVEIRVSKSTVRKIIVPKARRMNSQTP